MSAEARQGRRAWLGLTAVAVGLVCLLAVTFGVAAALGLVDEELWHRWLTTLSGGPAGATALVVAALTLDAVLPVPSSVVMAFSGTALGLVPGAAANIAGQLGSAWLCWALSRLLGPRVFERIVGPGAPRVAEAFARHGAWVIVISRAVPMLTETVSCLAGLTGMGLARFTALTALGAVPLGFAYAWAGSAGQGVVGLGVAVGASVVLPALGLGLARLLRWL